MFAAKISCLNFNFETFFDHEQILNQNWAHFVVTILILKIRIRKSDSLCCMFEVYIIHIRNFKYKNSLRILDTFM